MKSTRLAQPQVKKESHASFPWSCDYSSSLPRIGTFLSRLTCESLIIFCLIRDADSLVFIGRGIYVTPASQLTIIGGGVVTFSNQLERYTL